MPFQNYKSANLATGTIKTWISAWVTSLILGTWQGDLFPSTYPYFLKIEKYDSWSLLENKPVTKREIVKVTNKSGDTFTIVRSAWYCPATSVATTQTNTAYSFDVGDSVFLVMPAEQIKDIQDEVVRLETDKADDADVVHLTGDEDIDDIKTFLKSPIVPVAVNATEAVNLGQMEDAIIDWTFNEWIVDNGTYPLWETVVKWESLCAEPMVTIVESVNVQNIWDTSSNARVSIPAIGNGVWWSSINMLLRKFASPWVNLWARIETNDNWSASGTLFDPNATSTVLTSWLTTSLVNTQIDFVNTQEDNEHLVTLNVNTTETHNLYGVKFTLTSQVSVVDVTKVAACTATKAYLYDMDNNLLQTVSFSWNVATFSYQWLMIWQSYYVVAWSDGSSYTSVKQTWATSYPYSDTRLDFVAWWSINKAFTWNELHWLSWAWGTAGTSRYGTKIEALKDITINTVSFGGGSPTKAYIVSEIWNTILASAIIIWGIADFWGYIVPRGDIVRIEWDNNWSTYIRQNYTTLWLPIAKQNISYIGWSLNGSDSADMKNVAWINSSSEIEVYADTNINNITKIESQLNFIIPKWQLVWIVLFAGTYGSETISGTNYFGVWYSTRNTATRWLKTWNMSSRSSMDNNKFLYLSSPMLSSMVLAKTDADYWYKLPIDRIPRIAEEDGVSWDEIRCTTLWITRTISWMTPNIAMFISNTPWAISAIVWTNRCKIWYVIDAETLFVDPTDNIVIPWTQFRYGSNTTEVSIWFWASWVTFIKVKEMVIWYSWRYTVSFDAKADVSWNPWRARIYVNGIAVWTDQNALAWWLNVYSTFTESITLVAWDLLQIYARKETSWSTYVRNMYVDYATMSVQSIWQGINTL